MKTLRLTVDARHPEDARYREAIEQAAEILRAGGLVALPTETVYGLGANALDARAVGRIFAAKRRPAWDPVIVHIAGPVSGNAMLAGLVQELPERAAKLAAAFWPGPLTLLLPRAATVPAEVTAGRALVGIRMPAHPVAFELIRRAGVPVAAPSANLFSHTSPTTAEHVLQDLDGRIDAVLDAGPTEHGVESTVLDPTQNPMVIYRPGAVTAKQIEAVAGEVEVFRAPEREAGAPQESLPAPGVGIRHYAPKARVELIDAALEELPERFNALCRQYAGLKVGIMLPGELAGFQTEGAVDFRWGRWSHPEELARSLYAGLRELDGRGCDVILCPLPPGEGVGAAIRDRLLKAARPR
ncbi:threonylcarbamoyl-AMP synthase [Acidobacteria bacterium AB60]|nr:threonylcarbamoyl-AMP synthase [Acidobacteria bacterium AB60]